MGVVAGRNAPPGRIMGHAGAWAAPGEPDAVAKSKALERAGVFTVSHPEQLGDGMKTLLDNGVGSRGGMVSLPSMHRTLLMIAVFFKDG